VNVELRLSFWAIRQRTMPQVRIDCLAWRGTLVPSLMSSEGVWQHWKSLLEVAPQDQRHYSLPPNLADENDETSL
jgi:hypothetical protein